MQVCLRIHICTNQGWWSLKMDNFDQTAVSMMTAIEFSFDRTNVSNLHEQAKYLPTDWALINSGREQGPIAYFQKEHNWELFVWCFNHWLKLALKNILKDLISLEFTNESLMFLYCLYHKWLKKLQKLKYLSNVLKDGFLMYVDAVVAQSTGTC